MTAPSAFAGAGDCGVGTDADACLYADANYSGFMSWFNTYWNTSVVTVNLSYGGFNDRMSSWINNGPHDARWFWDSNAHGDSRCVNNYSYNSYVGWYDNDEASSIQVYTDGKAC
ncbi:peptidase inhibitor family I36 protein [Kitasatospora sp. NPDC057198]|uniref:peptidase inhibitor family I36 protein n=1 Tax=Kitasatospora sp. NPDC057198 TaxID=3346046 RepID=UPI00362A22E5